MVRELSEVKHEKAVAEIYGIHHCLQTRGPLSTQEVRIHTLTKENQV